MIKTISLVFILLSLVTVVGFAGCIGSDPIVGSWEESRTNAEIVFNADNTATVNIMGLTLSGKWANQGNGLYTLIYNSGPSVGQAVTMQMSKNGKTMTSGLGYLQETYTKV